MEMARIDYEQTATTYPKHDLTSATSPLFCAVCFNYVARLSQLAYLRT
jgi:hypothetical protein